jgi:hypothetical protein
VPVVSLFLPLVPSLSLLLAVPDINRLENSPDAEVFLLDPVPVAEVTLVELFCFEILLALA